VSVPDKRRHRGRHPDDDRLFGDSLHETLRTAVAEHSWLLTRGYAMDSALKLVGDRHGLTARQRMAVRRSACTDEALRHRTNALIALAEVGSGPVGIDGYNLLITVESALSGGLILIGRDGCYRDLASIHGTYRKVEETVPALEMILDILAGSDVQHVDWYLDQPVANSGRLKVLIAELVEARLPQALEDGTWNIELVTSPDRMLHGYTGVVASSDSVVLDRCSRWVNLAAEIIDRTVRDAWKVDLHDDAGRC